METLAGNEQTYFDEVRIKIEPEDSDDYECLIIKDNDIKVEIKEELEDYEAHSEDDTIMSPHSSLPSPDSSCRVEILEQPIKKLRFRYLSELQGTPHGPLLGENSTKTNKTFPSVRLVGYEGREPVKMRCWLVDKAEVPRGEIRPHCHDLVVRKCGPTKDIVCEPHEVSISRENNYTAVFENMVVLHCVMKESECKYMTKEMTWNNRDSEISNVTSKRGIKKIRELIKSINRNQVYLYFEAYIEYRNSQQILCHALSNPIKNLKDPVSGDLKICNAINNYGPANRSTQVVLFTEKFPPDVKIKFDYPNSNNYMLISPEYSHRNVALTFRTPKLDDPIENHLKVKFCLFRESDGAVSNVKEFMYEPVSSLPTVKTAGSNKRRRLDNVVETTVPLDVTKTTYEDTTDDTTMFIKDVPTLDDVINVYGDITTEGIDFTKDIYGVEMDSKAGEFLDEIMNDISGSDPIDNWSGGSTMLEQLSPSSSSVVVESNGIDYEAYATDHIMSDGVGRINMVGQSPVATRREKILKDIMLTITNRSHINCLQKAVMVNNCDAVRTILSEVEKYLKLPSISRSDKRIPSRTLITKIRDKQSMSVLHLAVLLGRCDMIKVLLDFGFDPLENAGAGNTAFHLAATLPSKYVLQALVTSCVPRSDTSSVLNSTASSSKKMYPSSVLTSTNFDGQNILHLAIRESTLDVVSYIVTSKLVDIDSAESSTGDSPLHISCRVHRPLVAELLVHNGADMSIMNLQGYSPLHLSVARNDHEMVELLIREKSDPTQECISLVREHDDESNENETTQPDEATASEESVKIIRSRDAFALANDLMMVDILNGKVSSTRTNRELEASHKQPSNNGSILTAEQTSQLSDLLKEKDCWRLVVEKLNEPHLETFLKKFDKPEKLLLNYIEKNKQKILGDNDHIDKLSTIFSSLDIKEASQILTSN